MSTDSTPSIREFPFGGVDSYKYSFDGKENLSYGAKLFESNNDFLIERAYEDYQKAIDNIVNQ